MEIKKDGDEEILIFLILILGIVIFISGIISTIITRDIEISFWFLYMFILYITMFCEMLKEIN